MLEVSDGWRQAFPGAAVGVLQMRAPGVGAHSGALEERKRRLEEEIRTRFEGATVADIRALDVMQAYRDYYKAHRKTYHVQLQLESLLFKGRGLPAVSPLVDVMFMAEMDNLLLTAGHDLDTVVLPLRLDVSKGDETYTLLNGTEQMLKAGDMFMADQRGVISSVLYGPDRRTRMGPKTERAMFVVYAPRGVGEGRVRAHLEDIRESVLSLSSQCFVESLDVYVA